MKSAYIFLALAFLTSCVKDEIKKDVLYQKIIGNWHGENGAQDVDLIVKKNGHIELKLEKVRGLSFWVDNIKYTSNNISANGVEYKEILIIRERANDRKFITLYENVNTLELSFNTQKIIDENTFSAKDTFVLLQKI